MTPTFPEPQWRTVHTIWAGWNLVGQLPTREEADRAVIGVCQAVRDTGEHVRIVPMKTCLPATKARR